MALTLIINGQPRIFDALSPSATVFDLVQALELKQDRIALELNGDIAPRATWSDRLLGDEDRIELVHFVGGGT